MVCVPALSCPPNSAVELAQHCLHVHTREFRVSGTRGLWIMVGGLTFTIRVRAHLHQSSLRLVGSAVDPRLAGTAICSATASPRVFDRATRSVREVVGVGVG